MNSVRKYIEQPKYNSNRIRMQKMAENFALECKKADKIANENPSLWYLSKDLVSAKLVRH